MKFGQNIQDLFIDQIGAIFMVVIAALAIFYLVRREFSKFIGFGVFAMFVGVFVFLPTAIKNLGIQFFHAVFG